MKIAISEGTVTLHPIIEPVESEKITVTGIVGCGIEADGGITIVGDGARVTFTEDEARQVLATLQEKLGDRAENR